MMIHGGGTMEVEPGQEWMVSGMVFTSDATVDDLDTMSDFEDLLDAEEISAAEEGFIRGYQKAAEI